MGRASPETWEYWQQHIQKYYPTSSLSAPNTVPKFGVGAGLFTQLHGFGRGRGLSGLHQMNLGGRGGSAGLLRRGGLFPHHGGSPIPPTVSPSFELIKILINSANPPGARC